ncbi:MAG: response regulator transcription factor, partial [Chloroflexota bacterium]
VRRKQNETEKQKLLDMLGKQSDQLRDMTHWLIDSQQGRHQETMTMLQQDIQQQLAQLESYLQAMSANFQTNPVSALASLQDALVLLTHMQTSLPRSESQSVSTAEQEILEGPLLKLTAREREVLQLITNGKSYGEIAELLYLSETTIRSHRSRIMQKLGIDDLPGLVKFAIRHGLSTLE